MRRLVAWLLDGLPFDPRSRRALDETMLDWAAEVRESRSACVRALIELNNIAAIVRTVILCAGREVVSSRVPVWWLFKRTLLFGVMPAMLLAMPATFGLLPSRHYGRIAALAVCMVPEWVALVAPLGILLCLMWRPQRPNVPTIGTAVFVALSMFVWLGWVLPATNEQVSRIGVPLKQEMLGKTVQVNVIPEPTLFDLVRMTAHEESRRFALKALGRITGFSVLVGAAVILAESLYRRIRLRKLGWIAAVPTIYIASTAAIFALVRAAAPGLTDPGGVWVQACLMLWIAKWIHRRTVRENSPNSAEL